MLSAVAPVALLVAATSARTAAIAIRDDVPAYQKAASEWFTVPYIKDSYDRSWYLTEGNGAPMHDEALQALEEATASCEWVDLFLLTNGKRYVDWVAELDAPKRARIRLVYNTGAGGASEADEWMALGVRAYVGHADVNVAPVFYVFFLPAWTRGVPLSDAVDAANAETHSLLFGERSSWLLSLFHGVTGGTRNSDELWRGTEARIFGDTELAAAPSRRKGRFVKGRDTRAIQKALDGLLSSGGRVR